MDFCKSCHDRWGWKRSTPKSKVANLTYPEVWQSQYRNNIHPVISFIMIGTSKATDNKHTEIHHTGAQNNHLLLSNLTIFLHEVYIIYRSGLIFIGKQQHRYYLIWISSTFYIFYVKCSWNIPKDNFLLKYSVSAHSFTTIFFSIQFLLRWIK